MSLEKDCFKSKQWRKAIMQIKYCYYLINIWKRKQSWLKKTLSYDALFQKN